MEDPGIRLVTKVARLYHIHGLRQTEIAERLGISQSRVSRLLQQAEEARIIRTVVAVPSHIHADLEDALEKQYHLTEAHVIDLVGRSDSEQIQDLGAAAASIFNETSLEAPQIGWTSWSRTLRAMVDRLLPVHLGTKRVIEMLGDIGPPDLQHDAARATAQLASLCGAEPVFLRAPGIVPSPAIAQALIAQDTFTRHALDMLDSLDIALLSFGAVDPSEPYAPGRNFFTHKQLAEVKKAGAVGEICLRYIDEDGKPVRSPLDDVTIGVTLEQLRNAKQRWAVVGGSYKVQALRAALRGGWIDVLVTDVDTATALMKNP